MPFLRGAIPSPRHKLAAAMPHRPDPAIVVPPTFLMWPVKMSVWGNDQFGDCVTAEEAFAKACAAPRLFFNDATVEGWARKHGFLGGAMIVDVLDEMQAQGFMADHRKDWGDGARNSVDWTNPAVLASAIYTHGPVKLGVGADALLDYIPDTTSGYCIYEYPEGCPEDHCVSLCGYTPDVNAMAHEFAKHGAVVAPPADMPDGRCYALFTWGGIHVVDEQSMLNMTYEAWIRTPVTEALP